jgi:hypothetical protein
MHHQVPKGPRLLTAPHMQLRLCVSTRIAVDADSAFLITPLGRFGFHSDLHNSSCVKEFNAPHRLYVQLGPLGSIIAGAPTQAWLPLRGWRHTRFSHLVFSPPPTLLCAAPIDDNGSICAALRYHPGPHTRPYPTRDHPPLLRQKLSPPDTPT